METVVLAARPDHVMSSPDKSSRLGTPRKRTSASPPVPKQAGVGFTFVDQSEDLRSLADKKIVSKDQRHVIRSHVMRSVRHAENELGVKRPTGRDGPRRASNPSSGRSSISPGPGQGSSVSSFRSSQSPGFTPKTNPTSPTEQSLALIHSPSLNRVDPFCTLPCGVGDAIIIDDLMRYCFDVFIPMTFPIECKSAVEATRRRGQVLQSKTSRPATFFGMMSIVAAHRAMASGGTYSVDSSGNKDENSLVDRDFSLMKHHTIASTRNRIKQEEFADGDIIEAVFSLAGAATMIGNFHEARIHLMYIKRVLSSGAAELAPAANAWVPLYDVNCAMGTLSRPLFRLPWEPQPIPTAVLQRISPRKNSKLGRTTLGFAEVPGLSFRLLDLMQLARCICLFSEFNTSDPGGLNSGEHDLFRNKTLELQYDMLSYVYEGSPSEGERLDSSLELSPVEEVVRLAVLGMIKTSITRVLPSAGVSRALTTFSKTAIGKWFMTSKHVPELSAQRLAVWAQFIFLLGAEGQPEAAYFENILTKIVQHMQLTTWEEVEGLLCEFLYIPGLQRKEYIRLWNNIQARQRQSASPPIRERQL